MSNVTQQLSKVALKRADIMIPKATVDLTKWAVVACDQYTSEPEYWEQVKQLVGENPSTLNLIYPEVYLEEAHPEKRIETINATMKHYIQEDLFNVYKNAFFLVHRTTPSSKIGRWGLLVALDLEQYDYAPDSRSMIRATEGTILSRIPPRKEIRKNAPLELPHIMVLINDEKRSVIEPLAKKKERLPLAYETELMAGGGALKAWVVDTDEDMLKIAESLDGMLDALPQDNPLLYAMGDGNHSLATAKSCWMDIRETLTEEELKEHPARYALVELENIFDEGLEFEPIHRVLFGLDQHTFESELAKACGHFEKEKVSDLKSLDAAINKEDGVQKFGFCDKHGYQVYILTEPKASIAAGTLQLIIDSLLAQKIASVDYIHGKDVTATLGSKDGNIGLILPEVSKSTFFDSIIRDNALPRKTFSMGEAHEKRYYMEARKIQR
ncbi:MAG: DUF1015 domain-containing protein [Sphaerochaetaceae bacterium]|nr:DUF1015 domain-containing protein [uncultured Sphaerochaeta sp.]MDC7228953.1 DUF1015 domain-containing protein [Sphaerochaetaceae bacterium]